MGRYGHRTNLYRDNEMVLNLATDMELSKYLGKSLRQIRRLIDGEVANYTEFDFQVIKPYIPGLSQEFWDEWDKARQIILGGYKRGK